MATHTPVLHDDVHGGVQTTLPAHLLAANQWRTLHQMRYDPQLKQVPKKTLHATQTSKGNLLWLGSIPNYQPGFGTVLFLTATGIYTISGTKLNAVDFTTDSSYRRWSTTLYNGILYYTNELTPIRACTGSADAAVANAPSARYVTNWYDHLVSAYVKYQSNVYANRLMISDLYKFSIWEPNNTNEADHYDFVEWQSTDYPYCGITGLSKLGKVLWVYTPTAIIPLIYVGRPKVFQVAEEGVISGIGNTYPWTLACIGNVHFFYDGIERNFFAFSGGRPEPIGEPVKQYIKDNLNTDPTLASRMWVAVDVENTEIIWRFVSTASSGTFDKLVRFNYRYKVWSTGSDENIHSFCGSIFRVKTLGELTGTLGALTGTLGMLGTDATVQPRLYGTVSGSDGKIYKESTNIADTVLTADDPILETGDLIYGKLHNVAEVIALAPQASWASGTGLVTKVNGRNYLSDTINWNLNSATVGTWTSALTEGKLTFAGIAGKIHRYRFVGTGLRDLIFHGFTDLIRQGGAEK